ncbi:MAG: hypothetical protein LBU86_03505 [Oscillospiraceae bacterium]|nr:hypothetical protein [Oscillospiraceae bacterium]
MAARARVLWETLQQQIDHSNPNIDILLCDLHILDREFSELAVAAMTDMLAGRWKPGRYQGLPYALREFDALS